MSSLLFISLCYQTNPFSIDDMDDELLYQAVSLNLEAEVEENEKFRIQNLHDLQAKLHFISIANIWSTWYPVEYTLIFLRPRIDSSKIEVNTYLSIESDLSLKAYHNGVTFPISFVTLCDVRQLESVLIFRSYRLTHLWSKIHKLLLGLVYSRLWLHQ